MRGGDLSVDDLRAHRDDLFPPTAEATLPTADLAGRTLGLRARLEGGELRGLRRLTLDIGMTLVNVELATSRLLDELAELEALPPVRRQRGYARTRHRRLVATLHSLLRALERRG